MDIRTISEKERRSLYGEIFRIARDITRSDDLASEITQQTFLLLCSTRPWRREGPPFAVHLAGVIRSLVHHERLKKKRRLVGEGGFATESDHLTEGGDPSAEVTSLEHARTQKEEDAAREDIELLRASVVESPLDLRIIDLMAEGVTRRQDLVERTGESDSTIKLALDRIRRAMNRIRTQRRSTENDE